MRYIITTLGCKVNQFETQAIESMLCARGHEPAEPGCADAVIVNSCAVTGESERKSRQALRHLMAENPNAVAAACGCWTQLDPKKAEELGAAVVFGSGDRIGFVDALERAVMEQIPSSCVDDPFRRRQIERLPAGAVSGRTRASIRIQDGCANFCTYCIIPYTRGRVRSLPVSEAAQQAAELAAAGFRELVITGIEIASYGKDLPGNDRLADVVSAVAAAAPGVRLRLGSLEPRIITPALCEVLAGLEGFCAHFHLSLQSGAAETLRRMGRRYTPEQFYAAVGLLRTVFPKCGLTADLITGFPGETEAEHTESLAFIQRCGFSAMHVFPYSVRPGTKAAGMDGQVPKAVREQRAEQARAAAGQMQAAYLASCVGDVRPVLFETAQGSGGQGHADNYCLVQVSEKIPAGVVRNVKIEAVQGKTLVGSTV